MAQVPYERDVEGGMREHQLETIEIKDVDGDIDDDAVMRFIEYAYSGDYTPPDPDIVQLPTDSKELQEAFESRIPMSSDDAWTAPTASKKFQKDKKKKAIVWESEAASVVTIDPEDTPEALYDEPVKEATANTIVIGPSLHTVDADRQRLWKRFAARASTIYRPSWHPRSNNDEREDYSRVFLCHARLYKFSDRYGCSKLLDLTLQKLRLTLCKYKLYPQRMSDVVELIRYTYAHTIDRDQGHDKLRVMILEYAVCYFQELVQHLGFLQLLQEGGSLPSDLLTEIARLVP